MRLDADRLEVIKPVVVVNYALASSPWSFSPFILFRHHDRNRVAGVGAAGAFLLAIQAGTLDWKRTKRRVPDGEKTTRWCACCSSDRRCLRRVRDLGGQALVEQWVLSLNMTPHSVHDPVAGDNLHSRLAAGMDRDHRHIRADLPAAVKHSTSTRSFGANAGVLNLQAAFLSPRLRCRRSISRAWRRNTYAQPDISVAHDALHVRHHRMHDHHVHLARHDALGCRTTLRWLT